MYIIPYSGFPAGRQTCNWYLTPSGYFRSKHDSSNPKSKSVHTSRYFAVYNAAYNVRGGTLKESSESLAPVFTERIQTSSDEGCIPRTWKASIVSVAKKRSPKEANDCRPRSTYLHSLQVCVD